VSDAKPPAVQALLDLDRVVHEPARLAILTILASADEVEFKFLETAIGLTKGNLSSHVAKLEGAGYLTVNKSFRDRKPVTSYQITGSGFAALDGYRKRLFEGLKRKR
jgi:DNA-binding transcriptional ArsR family regulator